MVRGGTEAHRSSALTTKGTRELIPGAIGRAMRRIVLRDDEARAGSICLPATQIFLFSTKKPLDIKTLAKYTH